MLLEQIMIDKYIGVGNIKINNIDPLRGIYVYINFGQVITFTFIGQKKIKDRHKISLLSCKLAIFCNNYTNYGIFEFFM